MSSFLVLVSSFPASIPAPPNESNIVFNTVVVVVIVVVKRVAYLSLGSSVNCESKEKGNQSY